MKTFEGPISPVKCLAYSPDGATLATGCDDGAVRLWDASGGEVRAEYRFHEFLVYHLALSPDGKMGASTQHYQATVWSPEDGSVIGSVPWQTHETSVEFHPGSRALIIGQGRVASLLDSGTMELLERYTCKFSTGSPAFSPDGRRIALGGWGGLIEFWEPASLREGATSPADPSRAGPEEKLPGSPQRAIRQKLGARCLEFTPDGRFLAASTGWSIQLYDLSRGKKAILLKGHTNIVTSFAISPDCRTVVSGSHDKTIRIWDLGSGEERACHDWGIGKVDAVAFAPDGMTAAAGGVGGVVVWDVE